MSSATFAPIPNSILRRTDLSHGAKLCAARLIQYAGRDIKAYPRLDTLADELGMSVRAVQRFLAELESYGLIKTQRRGRGQSNMYILEDALLIHRRHFNTTEVADLDMPKLAYLDTPKVAHPYKRRNNMKKEIEEITAGIVNKWKMPR
jgi:DNA-binding transcriptional regulator GbsR (MarR family)